MLQKNSLERSAAATPTAEPEKRTTEKDRAAQAEHDAQQADRYFYGRNAPQDFAKARELWEGAAAAGHYGAMNGLGLLYLDRLSVPQDYAKAREWFEKALAGGNSYAMANLASVYDQGLGVSRDYEKAFELSKKSAATGNHGGHEHVGSAPRTRACCAARSHKSARVV